MRFLPLVGDKDQSQLSIIVGMLNYVSEFVSWALPASDRPCNFLLFGLNGTLHTGDLRKLPTFNSCTQFARCDWNAAVDSLNVL